MLFPETGFTLEPEASGKVSGKILRKRTWFAWVSLSGRDELKSFRHAKDRGAEVEPGEVWNERLESRRSAPIVTRARPWKRMATTAGGLAL
jgi:hypothetical protein